MAANSTRFALMMQCGTQQSFKIPLSSVHKFDENKHNSLQAYKFDAEDGQILYGTISFIADSLEDVNNICEASRRPRRPPERFIQSAVETTTDAETDIESPSKISVPQDNKRKMEDNLHERLLSLKRKQQLQNRNNLATTSNVKQHIVKNVVSQSQENTKKNKFTKVKPSTTVKRSEETLSICSLSKPATKMAEEHQETTEESPKTVNISKTVRDQPPKKSTCSKITEGSSKNVEPPSTSQILLPTTRNNIFTKIMFERNSQKLLDEEKKVIKLTNSLQNCYKKLQEANNEKEVLQKDFKEVRAVSVELENRLSETQEKLKKVRTLNENWQQIAMEKCDLMHAMFSEITRSFEDQGKNVPNVPVGHVNAEHIHIGRGVWITHDAYIVACYDINMKTKRTFVRKMLVTVFGYDLLSESTITGRTSNRSKTEKTPPKSLDAKKVLAIKDIYQYFLTNVLTMDPHSAELEADKTNQLICKKIAQIKRAHDRPKKKGRNILGENGDDNQADKETLDANMDLDVDFISDSIEETEESMLLESNTNEIDEAVLIKVSGELTEGNVESGNEGNVEPLMQILNDINEATEDRRNSSHDLSQKLFSPNFDESSSNVGGLIKKSLDVLNEENLDAEMVLSTGENELKESTFDNTDYVDTDSDLEC